MCEARPEIEASSLPSVDLIVFGSLVPGTGYGGKKDKERNTAKQVRK